MIENYEIEEIAKHANELLDFARAKDWDKGDFMCISTFCTAWLGMKAEEIKPGSWDKYLKLVELTNNYMLKKMEASK